MILFFDVVGYLTALVVAIGVVLLLFYLFWDDLLAWCRFVIRKPKPLRTWLIFFVLFAAFSYPVYTAHRTDLNADFAIIGHIGFVVCCLLGIGGFLGTVFFLPALPAFILPTRFPRWISDENPDSDDAEAEAVSP